MKALDPVLRLLAFLLIFMTIAVIVVARLMPTDGQTFIALIGVMGNITGFLGAIIKARYEAHTDPPAIPPPGSTVTVKESTTSSATTAPTT